MSYRKVDQILRGRGFHVARQAGSHVHYEHPDGRHTIVPRHAGDLGRGLVKEILREAGLDPADFRR